MVNVIGGYRKRNTGYIRYLYLLGADALAGIVNPDGLLTGQADSAVIAGGLILKTGASYNLLLFPPKACVFSEKHESVADGEEYTGTIEVELPRNNPELRDWVHRQGGRRWVAMFQDTNGYWYIFGEPDTPMKWTIETSIAKHNSLKIVLTGKMWHPAYALTDALLFGTLPPIGDADCGTIIPVLGCACQTEIDAINRRLDALSNGFGIEQKTLIGTENIVGGVYYEFTQGANVYRILGLSSAESVLLNRLKMGEIGVEEKSVRVFPVLGNQVEFVVPTSLNGFKIAKFAINHIEYSEGIEYEIIEAANGVRTIRWISSTFDISTTDLVEIIYFRVQSSNI